MKLIVHFLPASTLEAESPLKVEFSDVELEADRATGMLKVVQVGGLGANRPVAWFVPSTIRYIERIPEPRPTIAAVPRSEGEVSHE